MTLSPTCAARALLVPLALALAVPAAAKDKDEPEKPVTDQTVTARDVATTPITDLNLKKDKIPDILLEAQKDPYSIAGLKKCSQYQTAVSDLDAVLGPDFDVQEPEKRKLTPGGVAQAVVGAFIPFRGVIRELSGANKHEREFHDAIWSGMMRRSFLKGMGLKLGCAYPARPAGDAERKKYAAQLEAEEARQRAEEEAKKQEKKKDKEKEDDD